MRLLVVEDDPDLRRQLTAALEDAGYAVDAAMRATQGQLIAANATGCLEVFSTPYPETSWQLPWIHSLFGNAAANTLSGAAGDDQDAWGEAHERPIRPSGLRSSCRWPVPP